MHTVKDCSYLEVNDGVLGRQNSQGFKERIKKKRI